MSRGMEAFLPVSLFMPRSSGSTSVNKTGSWSFMRPRYQEKTAPCSARCPCGQDIPRIEMLVSRGHFAAAWRVALAENPLPGSCGRVCFHPCEGACNRKEFDSSVSINAIERFLDDMADSEASPGGLSAGKPTGRRVAIVGSGPAGLSAAYFLARLGYDCEIIEAEHEPGGVLRYGIPSYRLPTAILDREIGRIKALGVEIRCSEAVGEDFLATAGERFDAMFIGCGHGRALGLEIPGGAFAVDGLAFLKEIRSGAKGIEEMGNGRVAAVIGGGNTAIDVARSLLRLGAIPAIVYRRRREDMPAFGREIERAIEEGARLVELCSPHSIEAAGAGVVLKVQKMRISEQGADGRMRVVPVPGELDSLAVDAVYSAVGADADEPWLPPAEGPGTLRFGHCVAVFGRRASTSGAVGHSGMGKGEIPRIYGGDLVNAEESVADAIASGKEAAIALDAYFRGGVAEVEREFARCGIGDGKALSMEVYLGGPRQLRSRLVVGFEAVNADYFSPSEKEGGQSVSAADSIRSFDEIESALDSGKAVAQAGRCFNCGLCNDCDNCRTFCPEVAVIAPDAVGATARRVNADYCKGCGVCVTECPRCAMVMEEQQS